MNEHGWKTPSTPRGPEPIDWTAATRAEYVAALRAGRQDIPRPIHPKGVCENCDLMRDLLAEAGATHALSEALGEPTGGERMWVAGNGLLDRLGGLKLYPQTLGWFLGFLLGAALTAVLGLAAALIAVAVLFVIAVVAAF